MNANTTNWVLALGFFFACGTAYHYKSQAAHAESLRDSKAETPDDRPSPTPSVAPSESTEAPPNSMNQDSSASLAEPIAETRAEAEDMSRLEAALSKLSGEGYREGIFELDSLSFINPNGLVASKARAEMKSFADRSLAQAEAWKARGKLLEARKDYTTAYFSSPNKDERDGLAASIAELNERILREELANVTTIKVQAGDSLALIAKRHKTSWRMIQRLNGLKSSAIRVGQKLRLLTGDFRIEVSKDRFEMSVLLDGDLFQRFYVATGKDDRTPEGEFGIEELIHEPTWYGPDGVYPFGHEKNILGTRWLGFERGGPRRWLWHPWYALP